MTMAMRRAEPSGVWLVGSIAAHCSEVERTTSIRDARCLDAAFRPADHRIVPKGGSMAAQSDAPVLDLLGKMTEASFEASSLDPQSMMLVRIAALVAVDAPPVSYLMNLGAAAEAGLDAEQVRGVLAAVAPIVGTARVAAATGKIVRALALELEVAAMADEEG
jgi:4-carboxymuconolactone decarboxylase